MVERVDVAIVGGGAAGLMTAIWAGRSGSGRRIVVLDGAKRLGAKILVAGGGRCNVTHDVVDEGAFAGSSRNAVKKVLRRFDVAQTVAFFRKIGVELKREETGKLFPVTDRARTVLDALLGAAIEAGVELRHPWRVERVSKRDDVFEVVDDHDRRLEAAVLVLATGGRSLPKSGSDGLGYTLATRLGHTITEHVLPALVPLKVADGHFIRSLSGVATDASVSVLTPTGRRLHTFTGPVLCTHFGLSGPAVLDLSRYFIETRAETPGTELVINWLPDETTETLDGKLAALGPISPSRLLRERLPERLARALCTHAEVDAAAPGHRLTRESRRRLARAVTELVVPVTGNRGFAHAEVTAGGVPLRELHLDTMASRCCPGLYLVGEICDVDGRIGGYNFQWAWSSGYTAGLAIGRGTTVAESDAGKRRSPA
ncbi:MAG: BaiN/RdsA family NAD(P)/FAD-dependent oxidoreductase [Planctomycetota bacterium]|jgi:predicted Rossmann fold flavoprotein